MLLRMQAVAVVALMELAFFRLPTADASRHDCVPTKLELYVDSSSGNDAAAGTSVVNALRSIAAAQGKVVDALGSTCPPRSISVLLSNSAPHVLADSITVHQRVPVPIEYKSYSPNGVAPTKLAEVTSAIRLSSSCFKPVTSADPNFKQINSTSVKSIYVCDVGHEAGLTNDDFRVCELGFRMDSYGSEISACTEPQVYVQHTVNDTLHRLHYARWPNLDDNSHIPPTYNTHGSHQTGTVPIDSIIGNPGLNYAHNNSKMSFTITSGISATQAQRWSREKNLFIDGVPFKAWAWTRVRANYVSFKAPAVTLQLARPFTYAMTKAYYNLLFVQNALSELDTPEEYFVDTNSTASPRLYMFFDKKALPSSVVISGKRSTKPMFIISDTQKITFANVSFNVSSNAAIYGQNVTGLSVSGCIFQNLGQEGIKLSGASNSRISSSIFTDIGNSAMLLDGSPNLPSIIVTDNFISRVSWYNKVYSAGITTSGYSVVIRNNKLLEGSHAGIYFRSNSTTQVIEGNEIGNFVQNFNDFGSIYFFAGSIRECNHVIRNNYVHDGGLNPAIYLDNVASYNTVKGNLLTRTKVGIFLDGGINNNVTRNFIHDAVSPYRYVGLEPRTNCSSYNLYNDDAYLVPKSNEKLPLPKDLFQSVSVSGKLYDCTLPPPGYTAASKVVVEGISAKTLNPDEDRKAFSSHFKFPVDPVFVARPLSISVDSSNKGTTRKPKTSTAVGTTSSAVRTTSSSAFRTTSGAIVMSSSSAVGTTTSSYGMTSDAVRTTGSAYRTTSIAVGTTPTSPIKTSSADGTIQSSLSIESTSAAETKPACARR